jgi:hypothetical protein
MRRSLSNPDLLDVTLDSTTPRLVGLCHPPEHQVILYQYTQVAQKLQCCIWIEADELAHDGKHVHSPDPNLFHYCEERCKQCGYYCTRPLGALSLVFEII